MEGDDYGAQYHPRTEKLPRQLFRQGDGRTKDNALRQRFAPYTLTSLTNLLLYPYPSVLFVPRYLWDVGSLFKAHPPCS